MVLKVQSVPRLSSGKRTVSLWSALWSLSLPINPFGSNLHCGRAKWDCEREWTSRTGQRSAHMACWFVQHPECILLMVYIVFLVARLVSPVFTQGSCFLTTWWLMALMSGTACWNENKPRQRFSRCRWGSYCLLLMWLLLCFFFYFFESCFFPPGLFCSLC